MSIRVLPDVLISQIAAAGGRTPAAALKETPGNSLDAGASEIRSHWSRAASSAFVSRQRQGIARDEPALALTRHATSKMPV